jgi:hypothetical protein
MTSASRRFRASETLRRCDGSRSRRTGASLFAQKLDHGHVERHPLPLIGLTEIDGQCQGLSLT